MKLKGPISHGDFREELDRFMVEFADFLVPNTSVAVNYEEDYRYHIYAGFVWDSVEETLRGVRFRVRQLAKREQGDTL